jgi:hypothetical protein
VEEIYREYGLFNIAALKMSVVLNVLYRALPTMHPVGSTTFNFQVYFIFSLLPLILLSYFSSSSSISE